MQKERLDAEADSPQADDQIARGQRLPSVVKPLQSNGVIPRTSVTRSLPPAGPPSWTLITKVAALWLLPRTFVPSNVAMVPENQASVGECC